MRYKKRIKNNTVLSLLSFFLSLSLSLSTGSRTLTPVPPDGTQTAAADRGESQGALRMRVESSAAERLRGR